MRIVFGSRALWPCRPNVGGCIEIGQFRGYYSAYLPRAGFSQEERPEASHVGSTVAHENVLTLRAQAEQCRRLAKGTYDEATTVMLTRMATECDVKADNLERKSL